MPAVAGGGGGETQSEEDEDDGEEEDDDGQDTGGATADSDNTVVERDLNEDENGGVGDETEDGEVGYSFHYHHWCSCVNIRARM